MGTYFVDIQPCSDFLFARPSLLRGMAAVLDFGGTLIVYNDSVSAEVADETALKLDWAMVADDLLTVMNGARVESRLAPVEPA